MIGKQKAFVYIRRSQDRDNRQVLSIEGQRRAVAELIAKHDLAPIWLPEEEQSAHKAGRPIFEQMMRRIEDGEAKVVVTWEANRLARNALDGGRLIHAMHQNKLLSIVTIGKRYTAASIEDQFVLQIEFGMSKMTSDKLSRDVKRGNQTKYERREYPTYAITGYLNSQLGSHKTTVHDPDRAPQLIEVCRLAASGNYTLDYLWQHSQKIGLKARATDKPISKQTLHSLLRNKTLAGYYEHGESGEIKGDFEPLISLDVWDQIQVAMGWRKKRALSTTSGRFYPYKGALVCGGCGHNITAYTKRKTLAKTGEPTEYVFYTCTRKSKTVKCKEPQVSAEELAESVQEELSKLVISKEQATACFEMLKKYHKEMVDNRDTMRQVWEQDHREATKKLNKLLDMRINGEIDGEQFAEPKKRFEEVQVRTEQLLRDSNQNPNAWLELAEEFFSKAVNLIDTFAIASDEEKQRLLLQIGSNWTLTNKKVRLTPRKPYDLLVNRTSVTIWRARPDLNRRSPP